MFYFDYLFVDERHYFLCMWLYNFFVKMSVINYISTRSLTIILTKSSLYESNG